METQPSPVPRWPCPDCGYNLVGLVPVEGFVRCPECGRVNDLVLLGRMRQDQEQRTSQLAKIIMVVAGMLAVFVLLGSVEVTFDASSFMLTLGMAVVATFAIWYWVEVRYGLPLGRGEWAMIAVGSAVLLLLPTITLGGMRINRFLFLFWIAGILVYAFLRTWRRVGDRH